MQRRAQIAAAIDDLGSFYETKKEIRARVKEASRLYRSGDVDEGVFRFYIRMAMAQEVYLGLENKLEKQSRQNRALIQLQETLP